MVRIDSGGRFGRHESSGVPRSTGESVAGTARGLLAEAETAGEDTADEPKDAFDWLNGNKALRCTGSLPGTEGGELSAAISV